jgi:hypothetical protein
MLSGITNIVKKAAGAVLGRLVSQKLMESMIQKVVVSLLKKLAASTKNTLDDHLVDDVVARLKND